MKRAIWTPRLRLTDTVVGVSPPAQEDQDLNSRQKCSHLRNHWIFQEGRHQLRVITVGCASGRAWAPVAKHRDWWTGGCIRWQLEVIACFAFFLADIVAVVSRILLQPQSKGLECGRVLNRWTFSAELSSLFQYGCCGDCQWSAEQ